MAAIGLVIVSLKLGLEGVKEEGLDQCVIRANGVKTSTNVEGSKY
jgi:hypothetical protein